MASKFDKTCILCGNHHRFCGSCAEFKNLPRWRVSFDNSNCHTIFNTVMAYRSGSTSPKQCAEILNNCDLSYRDQFSEAINLEITAILAYATDEPEPETTSEPSAETVPDLPATPEPEPEGVTSAAPTKMQPASRIPANYKKVDYKKKNNK